MAVQTGRLLRFDDVRGYGFIVPDEGGADVFVHANDFLDDKAVFTPGTHVEFESTEGDRGLRAFAVRILEREPAKGDPTVEPKSRVITTTDTGALISDDGMCDVLSPDELRREITELLLEAVPDLTGGQIVVLRDRVAAVARKHGWVED